MRLLVVSFMLLFVTTAALSQRQNPLSLGMADAIRQSLRTNPRIAEARRRAEAARAEAQAARAATSPQATLAVFGAYASREAMVTTSPQADPPVTATLGRDGAAGIGVGGMLPLYTNGRLGAEIRRAEAMAVQAEAELARTQSEVAAATREAYLRVLMADALVRAAESRKEAARAMAENARAQWEAGKGIEATYLRAVAEEHEAERDVAMARAERDNAVIGLAATMGLPPGTPLVPTDRLSPTVPYSSLDAALAEALRASPEVVIARAELKAAEAGAVAARGAQGVQVYGMLMAGVETSRGMAGSAGATLGVAASFPLADGGLRLQMRRRAQSAAQAAAHSLQAAELEVEAAVRQAWRDLDASEIAVRAAESAWRAARASYDVVALRVENQKSILVEQLDALAAVRRAEEALARSLFDHEMANVRLLRAAGRLGPEDSTAPTDGASAASRRKGD